MGVPRPFLYTNFLFILWNNKEFAYLSILGYMGGGRKSGRGTPIFCFLLVLFCTMILLKFYHCSFIRFIFMTYYVLKCSKIADFYGFLVDTKQTLYKGNIPGKFHFPSSSGATFIALSRQTDRQTERRSDIARST